MTFPEFAAARKVLLEEQVGASVRAAQRAEDEQIDKAKDAIRKQQAREPV